MLYSTAIDNERREITFCQYSTVIDDGRPGSIVSFPESKQVKVYNNNLHDVNAHDQPPPSYHECTNHYHLQIKHERIDNFYIQTIEPQTTNVLLHSKSKESVFRKYFSCRWRVAFLALSGLILQIAHRNCISVALVCMTKQITWNITINGTNVEQVKKEYDWSPEMEGMILSSYFYGQIISPLISGIFCRHFGVRGPMAIYVALSSLLLILTPFLTDYGPWTIIIVRSAQGFFGSGCLPMYSHLWSRWAPKREGSQLIAFTFAGLDIGVIVAFTVSGWLCTLPIGGGWPLIFYTFGALSLVWCTIWLCFITDNPEDNNYITKAEVKYIVYDRNACTEKKELQTPWIKILTSGPVFAMVTGMFTVAWGMTVVFSFLPKYMNDVLKYEIQQNGFLSSLPFLGRSVSIIVVGKLTDSLLNRNVFRVTTMRKINQCGAGIFGAALIIPVGFLSEGDSLSAVALITLSSMALGSTMSGAYSNILEIFPAHASTISGLAFAMNGIGQISAPIIIGQMIVDGSRKEWMYVFVSIGVVYLVGAIVYAFLGSAKPSEGNEIELNVTPTENSKSTFHSTRRKSLQYFFAMKHALMKDGTYSLQSKHSAAIDRDKQVIYTISGFSLAHNIQNPTNR